MKIISNILIGLIKFYQMIIRPYLAPSCRYLPTCSEYTIECLKTYKIVKAISKSTKRVFSCHPVKILGGGEGFDPVNKELKTKK